MKKVSFFFLLVFFALAFNSFAQTAAPTDFFAGKWEITVLGTPNGDIVFHTDLARVDGKLSGDLVDPSGKMPEKIHIINVEEGADKMELFFSAQGYDINVELTKVDDDNLKGMMMGMFETSAKRLK